MILKSILLVLFLTLGTCSIPFVPGVKAQNFSAILEDLPIMPGLSEDTENSMLFDKPSGRVVEVLTHSQNLSPEDILSFYEETLPSLGWQKISQKKYHRQGEELKINIEQSDSHQLVIFTLTPGAKF